MCLHSISSVDEDTSCVLLSGNQAFSLLHPDGLIMFLLTSLAVGTIQEQSGRGDCRKRPITQHITLTALHPSLAIVLARRTLVSTWSSTHCSSGDLQLHSCFFAIHFCTPYSGNAYRFVITNILGKFYRHLHHRMQPQPYQAILSDSSGICRARRLLLIL